MNLRIDKLPDRTPVKLTINVDPDLAAALADYQTYQDMRHVSWGDLRTKSLNCFRKTSESLRETLLSLSPAGELS
ncbi:MULTISPECIES: DUF2274 domain-containing protein [Hyphomonas]|uniref:DUF2274 domain-containing protein n=1 Tax=Hyphomonas adhaerens TaxID=81029 RepID=A0A3B9GWJ6_9PROT|nr:MULTISPECIES: DUF2274 domain-containing protein [Hyphomonas]HAE26758.1 hypothetical protein [Hyphomonas adhaerens]|tara:strand:+ start:77 stop:301 length:225 start_codon:yes stop_codon:yes gene_type:complete